MEIRTLRDWRYRKGIGLRALARQAGVAPRVITNIEQRRSRGLPATWAKIAATLGVDPAQILEYRRVVGLDDSEQEPHDA